MSFVLLLYNKSELVKNWQLLKELRIVARGQYLSTQLVVNLKLEIYFEELTQTEFSLQNNILLVKR
jgi:hypothetical protein